MLCNDISTVSWCAGWLTAWGSVLGLSLVPRKGGHLRSGRGLAAILAALLVGVAVRDWLLTTPPKCDNVPGIDKSSLAEQELAGEADRRNQIEEYFDRQILAVAKPSQEERNQEAAGPAERGVGRDEDRREQGLPNTDPVTAGETGIPLQPSDASVAVFDADNASPPSLLMHTSADKNGWVRVPEDTTPRLDHSAVLANDRIGVIFRQGGSGVEMYGRGADRVALRAILTPMSDGVASRLQSVALVENGADQSALDATFRTPDGQNAVVRFEVQAGQPIVKTTVRRGATHLRIEAPCRFAVLPDFFGDDIVVDADNLPGEKAALPSENFLMHMAGTGEAIVLATWSHRDEEVQVVLSARDRGRCIQASEVSYGPEGAVYVSVLEGRGIWHCREIREEDAGQAVRLDWKPPFVAQWRVDWRRHDGLTDSWRMFVEKPDGSCVELPWFGQPEEDGTPQWLKSGRKRWTPALGSFPHPCWIDHSGQGWLQPLAGKAVEFRGPALLYPIHRAPDTPLAARTVVDVMRATLGVGPCEYVLDVEGQKGKMVGVPTCVTREKLLAIYAKREQKGRRAEVEQALDDVLHFVQHIRTRIDIYVVFGQRMLAYLGEEEKSRPELTAFIRDMEAISRRIDEAVDLHKIGLHSPEYAARLVEQFRATVLDDEGEDAYFRCGQITSRLAEIGANQDELIAKCREAVRILRGRATLAMASDPRKTPVAEEIRRLTHAVLRNPASFESPRH